MTTAFLSDPQNCIDPRSESLPPTPKNEQDFNSRLDGVVIPVWAGDVYLAKACIASVRASMGDIPITLFVDGPNTDTRELLEVQGVKRLVVQDLISKECAQLCTGTPWTKLLLFWLSPYERFLCLDADTIVWGDLRIYAELDRFDFIVAYHLNSSVIFKTPEEIQRYVFDLDSLSKLNLKVNWREREFANSGVFFARRGIFSETQLLELRRLDCWRCYDQGLLNFLRWQVEFNVDSRIGGYRFQLFPAETTCLPADRYLPRDFSLPVVIHWIGKKPKMGRPFRTANDYRKTFLQMTGRTKWLTARLFVEDIGVWLQRQCRSFNRSWQRIRKAQS